MGISKNSVGFLAVPELAMKFYEHCNAFGVQTVFEQVVSLELEGEIKKINTDTGMARNTYEAKAVILATGAHPRMLGVPNEERLRGKGVSYCGTCDGFFFRDKDVCVIGGGDVAVEDAIYLANMCKSVTVFHRREELRANKRSQELALSNDKIHFEWNTVVTAINGEDKVSGVTTKNVKTGEVKDWTVDGCFVFVGNDPNNACFPAALSLDERGYVLTDDAYASNLPGVFAVGDCIHKNVRQISTAVGDAGAVMNAVERYLREGGGHA